MKADWKKVKLGEIYEVHNGLSKGGKFFGSGFPFLSFSTVFNNWFIPETIKDLVQSTEQEQEIFSVKKDDVFITRTSETADELGMSCVALKDYPNATYNGFCKRLRPIESDYKFLSKYIGYYLRTPLFRSKFLGLSGAMTTRASLKNDDLLTMEISLPPLETQQKIASILSAYDDLIENNRKQIKLLEEAAQRLYKEWFVDLRFPGYENVAIVDGVPEGWRKVKVCDVIKTLPKTKQVKTADTVSTGKIPVIDQSRDFIVGYTNDIETLIKSETPIIVFGDHTRILKLIQFPFARGADGTQVFISKNDCIKEYQLYCALKQVDLSNYSYARHFKYLKEIELLVATKNIAEQFELNATEIFKSVQCLRNKIQLLQQARDKLLPRLMSGEMEV